MDTQVAKELSALRDAIAHLTDMVEQMVSPASRLSISEKAAMFRKAHESGDRKEIRRVSLLVNGPPPKQKK